MINATTSARDTSLLWRKALTLPRCITAIRSVTPKDLLKVVADQQNGEALCPQALDNGHYALGLLDTQRRHRLVHDNHPHLSMHRSANGDGLALTSGHHVSRAVGLLDTDSNFRCPDLVG